MSDADDVEVTTMIDAIIAREGGYVDHPDDRGGATKFGITRATLQAWRGRAVDAHEVQALTREDASAIYRALFFERPRIALLPPALQPFLFDCAVHHGPRAAALLLQRTLNRRGFACAVDGTIGAETARACDAALAAHGEVLLDALIEARLSVIERIVEADPSQRVFVRGWRRRIESFRRRNTARAIVKSDNQHDAAPA
jgi:lysozyme family protein